MTNAEILKALIIAEGYTVEDLKFAAMAANLHLFKGSVALTAKRAGVSRNTVFRALDAGKVTR